MDQLLTISQTGFAEAVIHGLSQTHKTLPARFFYDRRGSELFEAITRLPEYYPTRTERALLEAHGADIARLTRGSDTLVEFGSGSSAKTRLLLDAMRPRRYIPIDISGDYLGDAARSVADDYPATEVIPLAADFTGPVRLPPAAEDRPFTGFFPGSTIGNFAPAAAVDLLRSFRSTLGPGARLIVGFDLRKNPRIVEAAYDDAAGVTAAFNLNLLQRINRELDGTIDVAQFEHRAEWNDLHGRIEMHLVAQCDLAFDAAGRRFAMAAGETIHTENSYKYRTEEARLLGRASGWQPMACWADAEALFSVHLWFAQDEAIDP